MRYLNLEQLTKALTSLYNLYEANWGSNSPFRNEAEFYSFYVLLHLDSNVQATVGLYFIGLDSFFILFYCEPHGGPLINEI